MFFGGKGGVGKTVMAGHAGAVDCQPGQAHAAGLHQPGALTEQPARSGRLRQADPGDRVSPICEAYEIDTKDTIARSKVELTQKIEWFLRYADIKTQADEFVESATMNPAFEESAMFENMIDLMFEDKYEAYVFDTAPTANARRLLGMSSVYAMWVNKMMQSREEAKSLRELLSYSKKKGRRTR